MIHWPLMAFNCYLHMIKWKDWCIDDVVIYHSFVLRNYGKDTHDLVQAFGNDTAEKWVHMLRFSSHLSVQGYDASSVNISQCRFSAVKTSLFSPGGLPTEKVMTRSASHATVAQLQLLNSHLLPQCFFVEWDMWQMRFRKKLSWKQRP